MNKSINTIAVISLATTSFVLGFTASPLLQKYTIKTDKKLIAIAASPGKKANAIASMAEFQFSCSASDSNPKGLSLLEEGVDRIGIGSMGGGSWRPDDYIVKPGDVPVLIGYLVPRLKANYQRIVLTNDELRLEPFKDKPLEDVPIDLPEK